MPLFKLSPEDMRRFEDQPEVAMAIQLGRANHMHRPLLIISGLVAATVESTTIEQQSQMAAQIWMNETGDRKLLTDRFFAWRETLLPLTGLEPFAPDEAEAMYARVVRGLTPNPQDPAAPYGHLPYHTTTEADDVFYRWEPYPTSRRIVQSTKDILPGTFAAPSSEAQFVPTGFAAVARYALPQLFPARWRWEVQPRNGTLIHCGASVPLNGQSGGGVEVMFMNGTTNRGPIANPIVLPIL